MSVNFPMKLSRITKFGEISDIAKPWQYFVAQVIIKNLNKLCCGL